MTHEQKLEKKAMDFLQKNEHGGGLIQESLGYFGLMEKSLPPSNEPKEYHLVTFNTGESDGTWQSWFMYIDPATEKIVFLQTKFYSV